MIRLFAFDGDGCLYDTKEHAITATYSAAMSLGSLTTRNSIHKAFSEGLGLKKIFRLAAPNADPKVMVERFYEFDEIQGYDSIRAFRGARETLQELKRKHIERALVTNRNHPSTLDIIAATGLSDCIDDIVTADDLPPDKHKPDPAGLHMVMQAADIAGDETAYMGDTPGVIVTGLKAGVRLTIGFTEGFASAEQLISAGAHQLVSSWRFVPSILENLVY